MLAVVGLGNPGARYAATRHNAGFRVVEGFQRRHGFAGFSRLGHSSRSSGRYRGRDVLLVLPQIYLNRSGVAILELLGETQVTLEEMLVVVDDVYLPLGRLRFRRGGGDGGHNGLRSIIDSVEAESFPRLRIGVGNPAQTRDLADYVLEEFADDERKVVLQVEDVALDAVAIFLADGIETAMNRFNAAPVVPSGNAELLDDERETGRSAERS